MKWQDTKALFQKILKEAGDPPITLATDSDMVGHWGKRIGNSPYYTTDLNGKAYLLVRWKERSAKTVARFIWQGIADILWKSVSYEWKRYFGLLMAQPAELPKGIKLPDNPDTRSKALKMVLNQVARKWGK